MEEVKLLKEIDREFFDELLKEDEREFLEFLLKTNEPRLYEWLKANNFFTVPAAKSHHRAYKSGLFDHSLQVAKELLILTEKLQLEWQRESSPIYIGLLHDVCKMDDYIVLPFGEENEEIGIERNKDGLYPGHGEKSLLMLMGKVDLTEEEIMCIRYHMGSFTDQKEWEYYSRAVRKFPNVLYTHTADMIASQIKGI